MKRVGDAVARELSRFGAGEGLTGIVDAWPAAVGPEIARNAWPARIGRDGTLRVNTSSSAWAFELGQLEARIRSSLGTLAPARIRFAVGPLAEPPLQPDDVAAKRIEPSPAQRAKAEELAAPIADEKLRKVVAKTAALSLAQAESDRTFWYHTECPQAAGLQGFFYE